MTKVSLLVAVYNAADTLSRCLDSLLAQTLSDIQIICIDDASTDDSPAILARYAAADSRITTLRLPENSGQAHARNCGLPFAQGDFIGMADADDWLAPDALEQAWQVITDHPQTDAVLFDLVRVWPDGREERYPGSTSRQKKPSSLQPAGAQAWTGLEAMKLSLRWRIHGLYLVRAEIHKAYPYDETARLYSDDNTTRLHYLHSREVRPSAGRYYYYQNPRSTTQRVSLLYFESLHAQLHMSQMLKEEDVPLDVIADYEQFRWLGVVDCCYYLYRHRKAFTPAERSTARQAIRKAYATFPTGWGAPRKLGYRQCRTFRSFWLQEQLYFTLRRLLRRG
ncbi:MAG: glycosyltransferase family 2 protein [Bacteroidaceae bacterium]|nr:glycosyltransferase family 2 protein [Bacteroidaceae bacterium]